MKSMKKRATGGRTTMYNAKGSPAAASAEDTKGDGFKKGGKVAKKKAGGMVSGDASASRMDKRARGGSVRGSPFSSARNLSAPGMSKGGHEGENAPTVD